MSDMDTTDLIDYLYCLEQVENVHPTGSRYICDPPVMDTDEDYVVFTPTTSLQTAAEDFETSGFTSGWLKKRKEAQASVVVDDRVRRYVDEPGFVEPEGLERRGFFWLNIDREVPILDDGFTSVYYYTDSPPPKGLGEPLPPEPNFISLRKGRFNLILTNDKPFYNGFVTATELAKKLNITKKEHRIELFDTILNRVSLSRTDAKGVNRWTYNDGTDPA